MDAEQGLKFEAEWGAAHTDSERLAVLGDQAKAQILCSLSTKMHIKGIERDLASGLKALEVKMDKLHGCPKFRQDPFGWLRCNWQWLVIFMLVIKQMGLVEVFARLAKIGGSS